MAAPPLPPASVARPPLAGSVSTAPAYRGAVKGVSNEAPFATTRAAAAHLPVSTWWMALLAPALVALVNLMAVAAATGRLPWRYEEASRRPAG